MTTQETSLLRFVTTGSVDDGKSTLIGRLLYETKSIPEDQYEAIRKTSLKRGQDSVDLSLLLDGLAAEREQLITIDVAYRYFSTSRRKFIIADTPGHEQYTRNMVTGASNADLAIILIDARKGLQVQSRRHGFLVSLLQIPHLIVAVNKMDLVDYSEDVFRSIVAEYTGFSEKLEIQDITFIPVSALYGDNIVTRSSAMPWYNGQTLLHYLETVHIAADRNLIDFRFPVQMVIRPDLNFRGFAGKIASGTISVGEEVVVLPSGKESRIKSIGAYDQQLQEASAGQSVVVSLCDEIDISRGDMIVRKNNLPQAQNHFDAILCWMHESTLAPGAHYVLKHTTRTLTVFVKSIMYKIDVNTLHRESVQSLTLNEIGRVELRASQPLFFDSFRSNKATGSFILIDPVSNNTVAAGMIRGEHRTVDNYLTARDNSEVVQKISPHTVWTPSSITREMREKKNGHSGVVLWLTGLSGAGKSTIARALEHVFFEHGYHSMLLDGDNVRQGLCGDLGFSEKDRNENIRRVSEVAKLFLEQGSIVIATFISPLEKQRVFARSILPENRFIEIYIRCSLEVCMQRDPKGLYKKVANGEIPEFTGISSPYEEPVNPEIVIDSDLITVETAVACILGRLKTMGIVRISELVNI